MTGRVDKAIGKVFRALDETGLRERTLVIFTSDHGDGVASHRWTAKLNFYEESTRIPLMVSWPGVVSGGRVERTNVISHIDILPTFCDYAGIKSPAGLPRQSLRALIEKPGVAARDYIVTELADNAGC
jgi:arylsulfatase A-like enzyme